MSAFAHVVEMRALVGVLSAVFAADVLAVGDVARATGVPAPHSLADGGLLSVRDRITRTSVGYPSGYVPKRHVRF